MNQVTEILNNIFAAIFLVEAMVRLIAIGVTSYFKDYWNRFDFFVAIGSVLSIIITYNTEVKIYGTTILRSFRFLRLLRLLRRGGKGLKHIFNTFEITLQSLANIGGLLLLLIYMYAIVGVIYFGDVMRNGNMTDYINFESFTNAFITLFTVATADSWNYTMACFTNTVAPWYDCMDNPTYDDYVANDMNTVGCGNLEGARIYFVSFMFIVSLVFLKLFIGIIIEGYKNTQIQDERLFNNEIRDRFREVWSEFDPEATTFIRLKDLRLFLFALGNPLGFDETFADSRFLQDKFIASLELPTYHNFSSYQFLDVLEGLSFRLMVNEHIVKLEE